MKMFSRFALTLTLTPACRQAWLTLALTLTLPTLLLSQAWIVQQTATLPEPVTNNAVVEGFANGTPYIYSFGGIDSTLDHSGIHLRSFRCNALTGQCDTISDLPDTLGKVASSASRIGNIIYIIGGYHVFADGSELSSAKVHRYDVNANSYLSDGAPLPRAIDDQTQVVWRDSLIFVITGWSNFNNVNDVQIYNPALDSWSTGTPVPPGVRYRSFGSSGYIIGDTIYYYGGAASLQNFPIQSFLRKGVIDPSDPTQINWSDFQPDPSIVGYRMACTNVFNDIHWIGGSETTYNFDGIAYNGSGGVEPANRVLYINAGVLGQWEIDSSNTLPMDLRGVASINDTLKFLAGGMESGQTVSDKVLMLQWDVNKISVEEHGLMETMHLFPNPANDYFTVDLPKDHRDGTELKIRNNSGKPIYTVANYQDGQKLNCEHLPVGIYYLEVRSESYRAHQKLVISR